MASCAAAKPRRDSPGLRLVSRPENEIHWIEPDQRVIVLDFQAGILPDQRGRVEGAMIVHGPSVGIDEDLGRPHQEMIGPDHKSDFLAEFANESARLGLARIDPATRQIKHRRIAGVNRYRGNRNAAAALQHPERRLPVNVGQSRLCGPELQ